MKYRFLLPITLSLVATCSAAVGDEDVTMQVLDDTRGVDAIVRALRDAGPAAVPKDDERAPDRTRGRTPADSQHVERDARARTTDRLTAILDREEESEGDIEDFDIPEDLEIPDPEDE